MSGLYRGCIGAVSGLCGGCVGAVCSVPPFLWGSFRTTILVLCPFPPISRRFKLHNMPEDMRRLVTGDALEYQRLLLANPPSDPSPSTPQGVVKILPQDKDVAQGTAGATGTRFGEVGEGVAPIYSFIHASLSCSCLLATSCSPCVSDYRT